MLCIDAFGNCTAQKRNGKYCKLSLPGRDVKVPFSSIICVELFERRLRVYLENGSVLYTKCIRQNFDNIVEPLLKESNFFQPHKSFVVNIAHAIELNKDSFLMKNNILVPVSRNKYAEAKERF